MESPNTSSESIQFHEQSDYEDLYGSGESIESDEELEGIQPYRFEPPARRLEDSAPETTEEEVTDQERLGNTNWYVILHCHI